MVKRRLEGQMLGSASEGKKISHLSQSTESKVVAVTRMIVVGKNNSIGGEGRSVMCAWSMVAREATREKKGRRTV